ncbi:MAG: hypothetical protein ACRCYQ_04605 [Nocardioides sp.]
MSGPGKDAVGKPPSTPTWRRRRRLAEIFGDVLPETTADERDDRAGERPAEELPARDRWLRDQVPPHHDR